MAWSLNDLAALEKSIAIGALKVEYDGRTVVYRELEMMIQLRRLMRSELGLEPIGLRNLKYSQLDKGFTGR